MLQATIPWLELVALILVTSCWVIVLFRAIRSHIATPVISEAMSRSRKLYSPSRFAGHSMPKVSVIVPARNEESHIRRCLQSITSQSYPNFEVIAVDDCSSDSTLAIMRSLASEAGANSRLKILSITDKPAGWTGKTWASEQGFENSAGKLLLFTDADAVFNSPHAIQFAVQTMLNERLDALSGVPFLPVVDFWSRLVMPVWNLFSETFGNGIADVNDSQKDAAFVMGSFFLVKRSVFEQIGTYASVKSELQEDRELGAALKTGGFTLKMFKIDTLVNAMWSRDANTLWHGIRRTIVPTMRFGRRGAASRMGLLLSLVLLPFLALPIFLGSNQAPVQRSPDGLIVILDLVLCTVIVAGVGVKLRLKYHESPLYALLSPAGAVFLIACYAYTIALSALSRKTGPIEWRGRAYQVASNARRHSSAA